MLPALNSKYRKLVFLTLFCCIFAMLVSFQYVANFNPPYVFTKSNAETIVKKRLPDGLPKDSPLIARKPGLLKNNNFIAKTSTVKFKVAKEENVAPSKRSPVTTNVTQTVSVIKHNKTENTTVSFKIPGLETLQSVFPVTVKSPYLMENPSLCTSVPDLSILVIVHTSPSHFERRQNMRRTWINNTYFKDLGSVRVLFLLGAVKDQNLQTKLETEFKQNGDLLQGDFVDAYRNLTHKGVMGYKWIGERCKHVKMILKVDDDVLANTYKLLTEYLPRFVGSSRYILCNHIHPGTMPILREKSSKWYVAEDQFKGHKFYPRYCSGFAVMMSPDLPAELHQAASKTPFFWVDDVYLYGLLPGQLEGRVRYQTLAKNFTLNSQKAIECLQNTTQSCPFVITGSAESALADKLWRLMGEQFQRDMDRIKQLPSKQIPSTVSSKPMAAAFNTITTKPLSSERNGYNVSIVNS